ncbi:MAG: nitroreductase family protein [Mangrovibacterium sp.]
MDVITAIRNRYSERTYKSKPIKSEELFQILDAGRLAPSACNKQPWKFIVVSAKENLKALHEAYPRDWFATAPQVIVVCGEQEEAWKRSNFDDKCSVDIDAAIAIDHMTLRATELGIGSCWVCNFNPQPVLEALELPEGVEPIALLPIGYPASASPSEKKRKAIEEVVFMEKWGSQAPPNLPEGESRAKPLLTSPRGGIEPQR